MDEKWIELASMLKEPLNQLIVLGLMLGFYVFSHTVLIASGARRVKKQKVKWSWERFWSDIKDRLLAIYVLCGLIVGIDMIQWLSPLIIGVTPDETVMAVLNTGVIIALPFVAGMAELYQAARNTIKLWGWSKNVQLLQLNESDFTYSNDNYESIVKDVGEFAETLLKKSVREQLIEDGVDIKSIEGEQAPGQGSGNTYPEPYRSAPKDSLIDPSRCFSRECVSYTSWKICETKGAWPTRTGAMSAKYWVDRLPSWGYKMVSTPKNGGKYIGVLTSGTYGHVVWFEGLVNQSTVLISDYNYYEKGNYNVHTVPILGYIWYEIQAPTSTQPTLPENTGNTNGFKVGDTVLPIKYTDYTGKRIRKTKDYYTITQLNGDRAVLSADGSVYAAVNTNNLKHVEVKAETPPPAPVSTTVEVGDVVVPTQLVDYNGTPVAQYDPNYTVIQKTGDRVVLSARGQVWAAMKINNVKKV